MGGSNSKPVLPESKAWLFPLVSAEILDTDAWLLRPLSALQGHAKGPPNPLDLTGNSVRDRLGKEARVSFVREPTFGNTL